MTTITPPLRFLCLIIVISCFCHNSSLSQNTEDLFTLPGLRFGVDVTDDISQTYNYSLFYQGDTLYNGDKFLIYQHYQGFDFYIKIDQDKIYEATYHLDEYSEILFDFSLEIGDSVSYENLVMTTWNLGPMVVIEKSIIQLNDGLDRLQLKLKDDKYDKIITWIQGIGFDDKGPIVYYNSWTQLKCVSAETGDIYIADDFSAEECDERACLALSPDFAINQEESIEKKVVLKDYTENYNEIVMNMGDGSVFNEFIYEYEYQERGCYKIEVNVKNFCGKSRSKTLYYDYCEDPKWYKKGPEGFSLISFLNEDIGLSLKKDSIFKTFDGGESWIFQNELNNENTFSYLDQSLTFKNENLAIATVYNNYVSDKIFLSTDGGINWKPIYDGPLRIKNAVVSDSGIVVASTKNLIIRSENNGESWTVKQRTDATNALYLSGNIDEIIGTVDHNYDTDPYQYFVQTSNNYGLSWRTTFFDETIYSVHFVNKDIGYVGGYDRIYKTVDGGHQWNIVAESIDPSAVVKLYFANENKGIAVFNNSIFMTEDGGQSWNIEYCQNKDFIRSIFRIGETAFALFSNQLYERTPNPDYDCEDVNSSPQLVEWEVVIYPNPGLDHFQILSDIKGSYEIEIINLNGEIIKKKFISNNETVDISDLANGLYIVYVVYQGLKKALRLIKL